MADGVEGSQRMMEMFRRHLRWLFVNRLTGRITVTQWPNLPLALFIVGALLTRLFRPAGTTADVLRIATSAALVVWSLDELVRGVNPFRRLLGLGILVATLVNLARWVA
jgi:hypothetical protein